MKHTYIISLLFISLLFGGCRKEMPKLTNPIDRPEFETWGELFNSFWVGMNNNYTFWDIDPTDWDAVREKYAPLFDTLSLTKPYAPALARKYFVEITSTLIDHHYRLSFPAHKAEMPLFRPSQIEVESRDYYHEKLDYSQFEATIRHNAARISSFEKFDVMNDDGSVTFYAHSYLLDGGIAYLRFDEFALQENIKRFGEPMFKVINNFHNLIYQTPNLKGVVIDTRSNAGGNFYDLALCAGMLVGTQHKFAESRIKNGMGRLDYSPWSPVYFAPFETGAIPPNVPIVSLVDVWSISMGEILAMAIQSLPHGVVIGERTFGATGLLINNIYYLSGMFANPEIDVYTSFAALRDLNGNCLEGKGIMPDIVELYDEASFQAGIDNQLERAIQYINMEK